MNSICKNIILNLSENRYITAGELAEIILVNEKTIRNYIKEVGGIVKDYGAEVERKHGYGYKLLVHDNALFSTIFTADVYQDNEEYLPQNAEERCHYIIMDIITNEETTLISELAERLYVSEYTIQSDLNKVRKILESYNLKLVTKNYDELYIEGSEFDRRIFLVNYDSLYSAGSDEQMKQQISSVLLRVFEEYDVSISEVSVQNLILHLYMAIKRIRSGNAVEFNEDPEILKEYNDNRCSIISNKVCDQLSELYDVEFDASERHVFALHLFGHRVTEKYGVGNTNVVISQEIYDDVMNILQFIHATLGVDQRKNLNLIMNLAVHMVSLDVRIRYNIRLKNPLLVDIKKKYALGYTMASQAKI